jgi:tetratricopeptide (TPR) repeat protein
VAKGLAVGVLGWAFLEQENFGAAISHLEQAVDRFRAMPLKLTEGRFLSVLSEAYLGGGDTSRALECAQRARTLSQADGNPFTRALSERAFARIARAGDDLAGAKQLLSDALRIFESMGARIDAAITRVELARLLDVLGDRGEARDQFEMAATCFDLAGARARASVARKLAGRE